MKSEYLMALIFRILGLLLGLQAVAFIPGIMLATSEPFSIGSPTWPFVMPQVLGLVLCLPAAFVLFRYGRWLAKLVVDEDEHLELAGVAVETADTLPVFHLLLRVVGAFVVAWSVPELAGHGFAHVMVYQLGGPQIWTQIAPGVVKLAIGVYLLKGGTHLVRFAYGSQPVSDDPEKDQT